MAFRTQGGDDDYDDYYGGVAFRTQGGDDDYDDYCEGWLLEHKVVMIIMEGWLLEHKVVMIIVTRGGF